jgi:hypothetical protein
MPEAGKETGRSVAYEELSNDELQQILCAADPEMCRSRVTDETRRTVIAMREVSCQTGKTAPADDRSAGHPCYLGYLVFA